MAVETVDELLKGIITSLDATKSSIDTILSKNEYEDCPQLVKDLLKKLNLDKIEGVSLLSLKNHSLLSYLNSLTLIILGHLQRLDENEDPEKVEKLKSESVTTSIIQRVYLEKGIKPLEKKLGYQLDKMVRSYSRMESDEQRMEIKLNEEQEGKGSDEESASEESSSGEDDDDNLSYRPDAASLAKLTQKKSKESIKRSDHKESKEKYRPPKISAAAPPTKLANDLTTKSEANGRKLQSMEEYLRENSDMPQVEMSIGSTIINNGRGGVKTSFDRQKEKEIQNYEENNFIRLPQSQTKKSFKQKQHDIVNNFGGEDWAMFNNKRDLREDVSRKRKTTSAWDRAKKRRS